MQYAFLLVQFLVDCGAASASPTCLHGQLTLDAITDDRQHLKQILSEFEGPPERLHQQAMLHTSDRLLCSSGAEVEVFRIVDYANVELEVPSTQILHVVRIPLRSMLSGRIWPGDICQITTHELSCVRSLVATRRGRNVFERINLA